MKETLRHGDRFDGRWLRDEVPALNQFMAYLMPNRTDCEAHISEEFDLTAIDEYLSKKNEGLTEDKYTYFHVVMAAAVKCFVLRPKLNRFITGNKIYQRDKISVSFVVKKQFSDSSSEALAFKYYDGNDTIDTLHESIVKEIHECRRDDVADNSTGIMEKLIKLPPFVIRTLVGVLFILDRKGKVPYDLIKADPNYSSIFLTNLGSIGMRSGYHHLNIWGTNSFFCVVGKKMFLPEWNEDGSYEIRPVLPLGMTLDERIADGFYYAGTLRLLSRIFENPEILDLPFSTEIDY